MPNLPLFLNIPISEQKLSLSLILLAFKGANTERDILHAGTLPKRRIITHIKIYKGPTAVHTRESPFI